jgi:pimeloyl-ACP methyl ester carboxylesterase
MRMAACVFVLAFASACTSSSAPKPATLSSTTVALSGPSTITATTSATTAGAASPAAGAPSTATRTPLPKSKPCGPVIYSFPKNLYPFENRCFDFGFGDYHYFDESPSGPPIGTVLMVHGNPTSSFLYRDVAKNLLARGYRVVAMDHYGFGESGKPSVDAFGYRPSDHSRILIDFVDALELKGISLVVQDWGGPIGLGMAVRRPNRIKNITIMNTWAWQVTEADSTGPYGELTRWSQLNETLGDELVKTGLITKGATGVLASPYPEPLATDVKNAYYGPFFNPATGELRSATVAVPTSRFARSILRDTDMFATLGKLEPIIDKPVAFYFGAVDPLFGSLTPSPDGTCAVGAPAMQGDQTRCATPNGDFINPYLDRFVSLWNPAAVKSVEINTESSHFPQEQSPGHVADLVNSLNR